jgi:hypothetical protein
MSLFKILVCLVYQKTLLFDYLLLKDLFICLSLVWAKLFGYLLLKDLLICSSLVWAKFIKIEKLLTQWPKINKTNIPNTNHSCVDRLVIIANISNINHLSQLYWSSSNNKLSLFLFCVSVWEGRERSGPLSANARRVRQDGDEEERRRSSAGQIMLPYLIQNLV